MKKRILTQIVLLLLVATMCVLSSCNVEQFRGEQGAIGEKGDTGATGNGIASITTEKVDGGTKVIIQYTDPSVANTEFIIPDGEKGEQGIQGEKGDKGDQGIQGEKGEDGEKGDTGDAGRGILKTEIIDGCLWITFTDDPENPVNVGRVLPEETTPPDEDEEEPEEEPLNMGGYTYKAYVRDFAGDDPDVHQAQVANGNNDYRCIDFWVSEENSEIDVISYAVYNRNQKIENDYNCKIKQVLSEGSQIEHLASSYMYGEGYDLTIIMAKAAAQAATYGLLKNLKGSTYLDLSNPSFDQNSVKELSVAHKLYFLSGDMNISTMDVLPLTVVNMGFYENIADVVVEEFGYDTSYQNIYNVVQRGKWTMDTMMQIAEIANADMDYSDGTLSAIDKGDYIGYYQYLNSSIWYYYGSGGRITQKNARNLPEFAVQSWKNEEIYNYLFDRFNRNYGGYWVPQSGSAAINSNFLTGQVLFADMSLFNVRTEIYPYSEYEYGILPLPVLEEGMDYQSVVYFNNRAHLWAIPAHTNNGEYAERMMEIMAVYSSLPGSTMDAYYERTIYLQAAKDNGSREVMDMIRNSTVYDIALLYPEWGNIETKLIQISNVYYPEYADIVESLSYAEEIMQSTIEMLLYD